MGTKNLNEDQALRDMYAAMATAMSPENVVRLHEKIGRMLETEDAPLGDKGVALAYTLLSALDYSSERRESVKLAVSMIMELSARIMDYAEEAAREGAN